ncbi:MAG: lipid-A-disaccharide synthase [Gemmatimonadota bacterium]|nr:lipid-A-disaccharide synthase [Gemmatimonadota bacterium]
MVPWLGLLTDSKPTILVLAGETSGDLHAAKVVAELRVRNPNVRFLGMGGPKMKAQGVELFAELGTLAIMGFSEVIARMRYFLSLRRKVLALIHSESPDLVILVDYPGFNLTIAKAAHERGCPVLYYIPPKVWAWNERRARTLATVADAVASIHPFEVDLLKEHGVNVEYVGHPLLDRAGSTPSRGESFRAWGLDPERPLLGILPGSRIQEVERHLKPFIESARAVVDRRPGVQVLISQAPGLEDSHFRDLEFSVVRETPSLLRWSDCVLTKSGTSTLETALEGTPLVVAHRVSWLSGVLARLLLRTRYIGLPNLVTHQEVVPEVLQGEVRPEVIAPLLLELIDESSPVRIEQIQNLGRVTRLLGEAGASSRVAEMAMTLVERHS